MIDISTWRRPRSAVAAVLLALVVSAAAGCGGGGKVPSDSVAVINGQDITQDQLDQLMAQAQAQYKAQKQSFPKRGTAQYEALQQQAVQRLVELQELEIGAQQQGVTVTDQDITKRLQQIKAQFFTDPKTKKVDETKYQAALKAQGLTEAQLRSTLKQQLLQQKLFNKITSTVRVTDSKITSYYNQNKKTLYTTPATRHVRHILVKDKKTADKLYNQLSHSDAQFAALAKKYSTDPGSKTKGGDLGTVTKGQTVPQFDKVAFSIGKNVVSHPVKTQFGYHIIEALGDVVPAKTKTLNASLRTQIRTQLEGTQKQKAFFTWFTALQKKLQAKIKYAKGFAPPATTASGTTTT